MAMTCAALGIERKEMIAAKKVRDGLREGRYRHVTSDKYRKPSKSLRPAFDMSRDFAKEHCGTVGCIGGWMAFEMKHPNPSQYVAANVNDSVFSDLFCPDAIDNWNDIKPRHAAQAIDNFLNTGDPQWHTVIK